MLGRLAVDGVGDIGEHGHRHRGGRSPLPQRGSGEIPGSWGSGEVPGSRRGGEILGSWGSGEAPGSGPRSSPLPRVLAPLAEPRHLGKEEVEEYGRGDLGQEEGARGDDGPAAGLLRLLRRAVLSPPLAPGPPVLCPLSPVLGPGYLRPVFA